MREMPQVIPQGDPGMPPSMLDKGDKKKKGPITMEMPDGTVQTFESVEAGYAARRSYDIDRERAA